MATQVTLTGQFNKPYVPVSRYEDDPLYALLTIAPEAAPRGGAFGGERPLLQLALVVDASGSMYNFQLSPQEREYWLSLALSRNEMERGEADDRDAVYWSGQTLQEMQGIVRRPMTLAVDAIKQLLTHLTPGDAISVYAFADQNYTVFTESDWSARPDYCRAALDNLLEQRFPFEIGTGTHMSEALRQAGTRLEAPGTPDGAGGGAARRVIVLSDGIVQDRRDTLGAVEELQAKSLAVSTIGVGDDFDEEFLMQVADDSRGAYYYAADITEITDKLLAELSTVAATSLHQVHISAEGLGGAIVQDVYMVSPTMTIFDEMESDGGTLRTRMGDLPGDHPTLLLLQIAPALQPAGDHALADITLTWNDPSATSVFDADQIVTLQLEEGFTDDAMLLSRRDTAVQEYVDRFNVYRYEREAQRYQERGDINAAREKLGAATRELQRLGESDLAADLEQQIASLGTGYADPSRVKRIKATTRKLADKITPNAGG